MKGGSELSARDESNTPLGNQFRNGPFLIKTALHQSRIEVAVVVDRVTKGVEDTCPPVADGFVTGLAVAWKLEVASGKRELSATASEDRHWPAVHDAVVPVTGGTDVNDHGVVEHVAFAFRDRLQLIGELGEDLEVMPLNKSATFKTGFAVGGLVMANPVNAFLGDSKSAVNRR